MAPRFFGSPHEWVPYLHRTKPSKATTSAPREPIVLADAEFFSEGEMLPDKKTVSLRTVAERVGLAPCSVSAVLNNTPASQAIPQSTKDRVFRAAEELNYRPNLWARSLRTKRTRMVAAITSDFGRADIARVIAGLQSRLHRRGYLLVLGALDVETNHTCALFQQRGIEGVIAIDTAVPQKMDLPAAFVDLGYMNSVESLTHDMQAWLSELGASAAETIIRQIEKENIPRRIKVEPKLPPAYFDLLNANAADEVAVRESA
jgi:DNA-binding LacI/PurR family transcriptional regulator